MRKKYLVEKTAVIDARPDEIFKVLFDVSQWNKWTPSISDMSILNNDRLTPGTSIKVLQPKLPAAIWIVRDVEFNKMLTWEKRSFGLTIFSEHLIQSRNNETSVILRTTYDGPLAGLAYRFSHDLTDRYMTMEMDGLKRECEKAALKQG